MASPYNFRGNVPWETTSFVTRSDLSPTDFVSKSLNIKLMNFHQNVVLATTAYPIDEGASLYEFFDRINKEQKGEYIRLLDTYNYIADSSLSTLVEGVIHWKISEMEKEKNKTQLAEKIRLLTEYLYCRIILALLRKWKPHANTIDYSLSRSIVDFSLDSFTINSSLIVNDKLNVNKQKVGDTKEPECFLTYRNELQDLHANILGEISRRCYDVVVLPFFELFKQISGNVSECIEFTKAIRYVSLPYVTDDDLEKSKSFIDSALQYVHKKQKIELTQAVFYLIGYALLPVSNFDISLSSALSFQTFITELYNPCKKFWKKFKDSTPAIIMEIAILCNSDKQLIEKSYISTIDKLIKYTKAADKRFIALECLFYYIFNLFCKLSDSTEINHDMVIEKLLLELYHTSKKSQLSFNEECTTVLVDIAHLLFYFYKKDTVFHSFIIQMLHPDFNHERINLGLKTFIAIADDLHITFDNTYIYARRKNHSFANTISRRTYSIKSVDKRYQQTPLDKNLIQLFQISLEQIFRMVDSQVGNHLLYNQSTVSTSASLKLSHSDSNVKDKSLIDLLHTIITTFSRIPPVNMKTSELLTVLIKFSFHIEVKICQEARNLLINLIKTRPSLRVAIVEEIGKFLLSIPEDNPSLIRSALSILTEFFTEWSDPIYIGALEPDTEHIDESIETRKYFCVDLFEGLALVLLCSPHSGIRSDALKLLKSVKKLSQELPNDLCKKNDYYVIKEMKHFKEILLKVEKEAKDTFPTVLPKSEQTQSFTSIRDLIVSCSKSEQEEIGHFLGKIGKYIFPRCPEPLSIAFSIIYSKIEAITPTIIGKQKSVSNASQKKDVLSPEQIILWRNYMTLALSIGVNEKSACADLQHDSLSKLLELTIPALLSTSDRVRDALHLALGYCKLPDAYSIPDNVVLLIEGSKKKEVINIRDAIRLEASHIFSMLSTNLKADSLSSSYLKRYFDYITETLEFLSQPSIDHSWAMQHLRFDFFRVCSNVFKHGFANKLGPEVRKQLFLYTISHCGYGSQAVEHKERILKFKESLVKDTKASGDSCDVQFDLSVSLVEYWALNTLVGLLSCKIDFENNDLFIEDGSIFILLSDIFDRGDEDTIDLGKRALTSFLQSNSDYQEQIMKYSVDKVFKTKGNISNGYFYAIVDAVTKGGDLYYNLPMLLNLSFYQMGHKELKVRRSAVELIHWMSTRFFRTQQDTFQLHVNSLINDRSFKQIYKISLEFSQKHEELRMDLFEEVMSRISYLSKKDQLRMASYICAWLSLVNLSELDDDDVQTTVERLVLFTNHFGENRREFIEEMWRQLASTRENISIIYDFILRTILHKQNTRLYVFIKICVYISEVAPKEMFQNLISGLFDKSSADDVVDFSPRKADHHHQQQQQQGSQSTNNNALSWNYSELFKEVPVDTSFSKGSFSITVLPELVLDHFEAWKEYIPSILHASFLYMDHDNVNTYTSTQILLKNLIFQVIAPQLGENSDELRAYRQLVKIIEDSKDFPLWKKDSASIHLELLNHVITSLSSVINNLRELWGKVALDVSLATNDNHFKIRSLQIYRTISPTPNREFVIQLLCILKNFLHLRSSAEITDISGEIITILKSIIVHSNCEMLVKLPELFWSAIALLRGNVYQEYKGAIEIITEYMDRSNFESDETQTSLISSLPTKWDPPFMGLPIYILKGLCISSTEEVARTFLSKLIPIHLKNEIFSPSSYYPDNLLIYTIALLPHLLTSFGGDNSQNIAQSLSDSFKQLADPKYHSIAAILSEYPVYRNSSEGLRRFLLEVVALFAKEYFPHYETFIFSTLLEMLDVGPSRHKKTIIRIIEAFLERVDFNNSLLIQQNIIIFSSLINLLEDDENWSGAIKVINIIASKSLESPHHSSFDIEKLKTTLSMNLLSAKSSLDNTTSLVVHSLKYVINPDELKVPYIPENKFDDSVNAHNNVFIPSSPQSRRKSFLPLPSKEAKGSILSKSRKVQISMRNNNNNVVNNNSGIINVANNNINCNEQ